MAINPLTGKEEVQAGTITKNTLNLQQQEQLKTLADKYGGIGSEQFKQHVNTNFGDGAYDVLKQGIINTGLKSTNQKNVSVAQQLQQQTTQQPQVQQVQSQPQQVQAQQQEVQAQQQEQKSTTPIVSQSQPQPTQVSQPAQQPTDWKKVQTVEDFKKVGSTLPNLENWIENRYGTTATIQGDKVVGEINGEKFQWQIDSQGNPIKTSLGKTKTSEILQADVQYKDPMFLMGQIQSGRIIPQEYKNTPEFTQAQNRVNSFNKLKGLNSSQYASLLNTGILLPNTQTYEDLMKDPIASVKIKEAQQYNAVNGKLILETIEQNQSNKILNNNPSVSKALEDGVLSAEEYKALTTTPEIDAKTKSVGELRTKYTTLKASYDNIENDVRERYKGQKGVTESYLNAVIAKERAPMFNELSLTYSLYQGEMGDLASMKEQATGLLETNMKLYKQAQEEKLKQQELEQKTKQQDFENAIKLQELQSKIGDRKTTVIKDEATGEQKLIDSTTGEIIQSFKTGLKPETMTPYQQAQAELDKKKYELDLKKFEAEQEGGGSTISGNINFTITPGTTNNRPDRNNNPGNLKAGNVGNGTDEQGHTIFTTPEQGYQAMINDLKAKQTGNTRTGLGPDSTLAQLGKVYAEDPKWSNGVSKLSGYSLDTKLKDIDINKLAPAVAKQEGFTGTIKMGQAEQKTFTDSQKNIMSSIDIKNPTKTDEAILRKNGLTISDVYNYQASKKVGKWSEGLDDVEYKRVNAVIDDLSADQITKTFKKSQEAYNFATKVKVGNNATDNQALIYAFAKAMDPDSVVREGEYSTVQKYSQTWGDQLGMNMNRILNGQEFISNKAKNNMVNTIKYKYEASKDSYNSLRETKIKIINDIAGKDIGEKALPSDVMEIKDTGNKTESTQFTAPSGKVYKIVINP